MHVREGLLINKIAAIFVQKWIFLAAKFFKFFFLKQNKDLKVSSTNSYLLSGISDRVNKLTTKFLEMSASNGGTPFSRREQIPLNSIVDKVQSKTHFTVATCTL